MTLLFACLSMALKDFFSTMLVVAEARGRSWLAGVMDAIGDLAVIFSTVYGAGFVIKHGWTINAVLIVAAMTVVSFFGTTLWTKVSCKVVGFTPHKNEEMVALQARVAELERRLGI